MYRLLIDDKEVEAFHLGDERAGWTDCFVWGYDQLKRLAPAACVSLPTCWIDDDSKCYRRSTIFTGGHRYTLERVDD